MRGPPSLVARAVRAARLRDSPGLLIPPAIDPACHEFAPTIAHGMWLAHPISADSGSACQGKLSAKSAFAFTAFAVGPPSAVLRRSTAGARGGSFCHAGVAGSWSPRHAYGKPPTGEGLDIS